MANLVAYQQFNIFGGDLSFYSEYYYDDALLKNQNLSYAGKTYPDYYWINGYDGFNDLQLEFLGSGFTIDITGAFTGGVVNVVAEFDLSNDSVEWIISDVAISAVSIYNAALTSSIIDEQHIYASALSGNDDIVLSPFADRMSGFAGNDVIFGGGGNDILDGGGGFDRAVFQNDITNYTIEYQGDVLVVSSLAEGIDQLTGFEELEFAGEVRSVGSLDDLVSPKLLNTEPSDQSTMINPDANLILTFTEAIKRGDGTITIREGSFDGAITETFQTASSTRLAFNGSTLVIDPVTELNEGVRYFVSIEDNAIVDIAGNRLSEPESFSFETTPPIVPSFSLLAVDGLTFGVGGNGSIFGTIGKQDLKIIDVEGSIDLDPSFNGGGNVIRLEGQADSWSISRNGSSAYLTDGDTNVAIPFGKNSNVIVFGDGARIIQFDPNSGSLLIGDQIVSVAASAIIAPANTTVAPTPLPVDAQGSVILESTASVWVQGALSVVGTSAAEAVHIVGGNVIFDPSFNSGGDEIFISSLANEFSAVRLGSNVFLSSDETSFVLPFGPSVTNLTFGASDSREVVFERSSGDLFIGDQIIGLDPVQLASN